MKSWILYVGREDGDFDRTAVFTDESETTTACEVNDNDEESLAYHAAHECAAVLESQGEEVKLIETDGPEGWPSVLEVTQ